MIYAFGDYELDTLKVELRHHDEVVHLEPQVFGVLAHLVANRDRVVSKIELLDEVWLDRFVSESALTSRLQAARKACGDNGREQRVIRTKHGRGYRFVAEVTEIRTEGSGAASTADRASATPVPAVDHPSTAIGRDDELGIIDSAFGEARNGHGRIVFVVGDAGMGKSTLVDSAIERVDRSSQYVMAAQCRAHRGLPEPYVSLLDALSRWGRDEPEAVVPPLEQVAPMWLLQLPSLIDPHRVEALDRRVLGGTHERMLREGVDLLETLGRARPLVLVIEDLHWADPPTIELLDWLAGRIESCSLVVLATFRPGEDSSGDLQETVSRLVLDRTAERIDLRPLDTAGVGQLIADRLDANRVEDDLARVIALRSGGNPLFVNELLDALLGSRDVDVVDGTATATADVEGPGRTVPEGVRQLIEGSLLRLAPDDVEILEAAAVAGREFPAFAVAEATGRSIPSVEDRLGRLARQGRFVTAVGDDVWPDGTVSTVFLLTHDLHHQTLYDRLSASRRATYHQAIGERLERAFLDRTDEHVAALVRHFTASADISRSVRYLHRSGELALARGAHSEAVEALQSALDRVARLDAGPSRDRREVLIRTKLGPALVATLGWREPEVQANYERGLELAGELPERFILRYGLAVVHELRGEYNRSEELLREQLSDGPELGVETQELLACSTFHQGAYGRSLDFAIAAIDLWDPDEHSVYMARYGEHPGVSWNTWGALAAWYLGRAALSMEMARTAVEWGSDNEYALTTARIQFSFLHQYRNEPDRCRTWAERTIDLAGTQGFPFRSAQAEIMIGWCTAAEGDADAGVELIREGISRYRSLGARMDEPYFLGLLADAELAAGHPADALTHLDEAEEIIAATTRSFFYEPELLRLRALALLEDSGPSARGPASRVLERASSLATDHGSVAASLRVMVTGLELGLIEPTEDRLAELSRLLGIYADEPDLPDVLRARELVSSGGDRP